MVYTYLYYIYIYTPYRSMLYSRVYGYILYDKKKKKKKKKKQLYQYLIIL